MKQMSPLEELRHSCAHILATAVLRVFPDARLDIGPPTDSGFYYDFDLTHRFTMEDLEHLEKEMQKIISERQEFQRIETTRKEASEYFKLHNQPFKLERLSDIPEDEAITFYQNGEFKDLCAGTHVKNTDEIKAFKLLNIAGAYFRGDEKNKQLQRIYGTAFAKKSELDSYLTQLEEAKKRDHRKLGKDLDLFSISDLVGPGLILWHPKGAIIRQELQKFTSEQLRKFGYQEVYTPHIAKLDLFRTSGHFPYYRESQFPPLVENELLAQWAKEGKSCAELCACMDKGEMDGFLLKPMNCPMHIQIYKSHPHSYRDLPVRLSEFGTVYRWEQSGELNGLTRVRGFTQDDAHLFCTPEQIHQEIHGCLSIVQTIFNTLGFTQYKVRLSLRDPKSDKYVGDSYVWDLAEEALRKSVKTLGVDYVEAPGDAAFYGPKIDFLVKDVIGREWQLGTVQLDYNLPERFDLSYVGPDNKPHRPVMIHRAPFGSLERFCGVLIEHFGGNFPTWLSPEQVRILPLNDANIPYAKELQQQLQANGVRVSIDEDADKLGAKIRRAETDKVSYMLVVGAKEAEAQQVSVRSRVNKELDGSHAISDFLKIIVKEIAERTLPKSA
jgi:threonyl-tRNA synthetase